MTEVPESRFTASTCPYCGVGCGVIIESRGDDIVGVQGDPNHPANFGRLCTKGSTLHLSASRPIQMQTRLLKPQMRADREHSFKDASWDDSLHHTASTFARIIREHGPDAVGFYISGQLLTEDYYVFNKLAKGLIGTNNVDTNSRLCMSSAVAGYKQTLGADAPPACYDDVNHADCLFITGSNTAWAHPILYRRIEDAKKQNPAMKIIVVDPRKTQTAELADLSLPILPGTDVALYHGMLHIMLWEGWIKPDYIAAHTKGFEELKATVREYTPDHVAQLCGISKTDLLAATKLFATSANTLSLYCQGLNQSSSGTAKNASLINLHLATAQIGRPGAGPFSLTGQPNAMGGREVGGMANLLSAHRDLANPMHRAEVAALWGIPSVPDKRGKTAVEMFEAAARGEIKALWIACTNPAQSMPDQATVRRALERCELVVVQEAFATTATCQYAHVLLPATTWGEKVGTVTNSERRISRVRAAVPPPGLARHDWDIAVNFAQRLEKLLPLHRSFASFTVRAEPVEALRQAQGDRGFTVNEGSLFDYIRESDDTSAEAIWNEHRESTRGRDLDITGLSYAMLDTLGPQQWPMPEGAANGKVRLYEDGIFPTADGKAKFVNAPYTPVAEPREVRFPFSLTTGRLRDQWHGMSRTGNLGRLFAHVSEPVVQMNPQDMARRLLKDGDLVHVTSKRGSSVLPVQGSAEVNFSQAFIAMHWGEEFLSGRNANGEAIAGVNLLTSPAFCPSSKQPELKHTAVKILKAELPWSMLAMAWLEPDCAWHVREALKREMSQFEFASCVPFSNNLPLDKAQGERVGVLFRAAGYEPPSDEVLAWFEDTLGLKGMGVLRYSDKKKHQHRAIRVRDENGDRQIDGFLLSGDTRSEAWIKALLQSEASAMPYGRLLLSPGATPPVAVQAASPQVCSCFSVNRDAIEGCLTGTTGTDDALLAKLQGELKCGTNCGSCVPELKKIIRISKAPAKAAEAGAATIAA
jgi:assimilatory nitrate reductase catalytic subunit